MRNFISMILLLTTSFLYGQTDTGFRNVNWGMSVEEVKKSETSKLVKIDNEFPQFTALHYKTRLKGHDCSLVYYFMNHKLSKVDYLIQNNYTDFFDYFDDYSDFKDLLIRKFGEPYGDGDEWNWEDDQYISDSTLYIQALKEGHLEIRTVWAVEQTIIILTLSGKDNKVIGPKIVYGRLLSE